MSKDDKTTFTLSDEDIITRRKALGLAALAVGATAIAGRAAYAEQDGEPDSDNTEGDPDQESTSDTSETDPDSTNEDTSSETSSDNTEGDPDSGNSSSDSDS